MAGVLTVLMVAGGTKPAAAQPSDAADRCTPDVMRLCNEFIPDADRIVVCLKAKRRQLSPAAERAVPAADRKRPRSGARAVTAPDPPASFTDVGNRGWSTAPVRGGAFAVIALSPAGAYDPSKRGLRQPCGSNSVLSACSAASCWR